MRYLLLTSELAMAATYICVALQITLQLYKALNTQRNERITVRNETPEEGASNTEWWQAHTFKHSHINNTLYNMM